MRSSALAGALAVLTLTLGPTVALAADPATLTVDGNGVAYVAPDLATLDIGVRSGSASRQTARSRADARTRRVLAAVVALGVPRTQITTSGVTLSRNQIRKGKVLYGATNAIEVRITDVTKVGPAVDAATRAGADSIDGPSFRFSDPSAGRAEATRAALADARRRADDAAAAVGQKVTGVQSIVIDPATGPQPYSAGGSAKASAPSADTGTSTPVSAGRQEVDATVEVVYTIAPA
jgi:uncharacterized protein YggE